LRSVDEWRSNGFWSLTESSSAERKRVSR
jgi:hypothetical protein